MFTLVVDDFEIKYTSKEYTDNLMNALKDKYTISVDWDASLCMGIKLEWNYDKITVILSMPEYVIKALHKFKQDMSR